MKSIVIVCGLLVSSVAFAKVGKLSTEQKAVKKSLLAKYDTNKDDKLDKIESQKMSYDERVTWKELGAVEHHPSWSADEVKWFVSMIRTYDTDRDSWLKPDERSKMTADERSKLGELERRKD